ncbi:MAG: hypothetical protein ACQEP3_00445 [Patescibacteria group bacterium]
MRKKLVLFIIALLVITLSSLVSAEDFAIKINDEYTLSIEEFKTRVDRQDKDLNENEKKTQVLRNFAEEVVIEEAFQKKDLELTEEGFYQELRTTESLIINEIDHAETLGHGSEKPPKKKIMERLVEFEETNFTYEELKREVEKKAKRRKLIDYFQKNLQEELGEEKMREKFNDYKESSEEEYAEMGEEKQEMYEEKIEKIREMTFEEYADKLTHSEAARLKDKLLEEIRNNLEVETNEDL